MGGWSGRVEWEGGVGRWSERVVKEQYDVKCGEKELYHNAMYFSMLVCKPC